MPALVAFGFIVAALVLEGPAAYTVGVIGGLVALIMALRWSR